MHVCGSIPRLLERQWRMTPAQAVTSHLPTSEEAVMAAVVRSSWHPPQRTCPLAAVGMGRKSRKTRSMTYQETFGAMVEDCGGRMIA